MRSQHLTTALLAGLALILLVGNADAFSFHKGKGIEGSGDLETREFDLADFDEISVGGAFEVEVRFGDDQKVAVTIDDNLWDNLELEVEGGRLIINWDKSCQPDGDCRLELVVSSLEEMSISGAADVDITDFEGDRFEFRHSGAADLEMSGEVDKLDIQVSGAGDIDTRDLQARHVKVRISGAGNANITASESLDAKVSGVGNISYWGDPQEKQTSVSGMGHIRNK
jgi:hypothetical protein